VNYDEAVQRWTGNHYCLIWVHRSAQWHTNLQMFVDLPRRIWTLLGTINVTNGWCPLMGSRQMDLYGCEENGLRVGAECARCDFGWFSRFTSDDFSSACTLVLVLSTSLPLQSSPSHHDVLLWAVHWVSCSFCFSSESSEREATNSWFQNTCSSGRIWQRSEQIGINVLLACVCMIPLRDPSLALHLFAI